MRERELTACETEEETRCMCGRERERHLKYVWVRERERKERKSDSEKKSPKCSSRPIETSIEECVIESKFGRESERERERV